MAGGRTQQTAAVGVAEHGNSAVLVTVGLDGELLDRRSIDLTSGLPTHPHHHEGSWAVGRYRDSPWAREISLAEAVALVERVRAVRGARGARGDRGAGRGGARADRRHRHPRLPRASADDRGTHRRQPRAGRRRLRHVPRGPRGRGQSARLVGALVRPRQRVLRDAATATGREDIDAALAAMGRSVGRPGRPATSSRRRRPSPRWRDPLLEQLRYRGNDDTPAPPRRATASARCSSPSPASGSSPGCRWRR